MLITAVRFRCWAMSLEYFQWIIDGPHLLCLIVRTPVSHCRFCVQTTNEIATGKICHRYIAAFPLNQINVVHVQLCDDLQVNFGFLCNIVRILIFKLHSHPHEPSNFRSVRKLIKNGHSEVTPFDVHVCSCCTWILHGHTMYDVQCRHKKVV